MNIKTFFMLILLGSSLTYLPVTMSSSDHQDDNATEESHDEHEEKNGAVKLTTEQMQAVGIEVKPLQLQLIQSVIKAPGEVKFNTYKTTSITPRIAAQVLDCHVVLGEMVSIGQPIVTLSSVEMAEAQGALLVADREWQRVKKLGQKVVSQSRYTKAKINSELARAKVKAYGMTDSQINSLISSEDFSRANGRFELVATRAGTVLVENYIQGQQVEPGHELIRITDESSLWIVAKVPPAISKQITIGSNASVNVDGQVLSAKVIQKYHSLDESTRTNGIRLAIENVDDMLHPGMFVNTQIETSSESKVLAVPEEAVLRSEDGDWIVMTQDENGEFTSQKVELVRVSNGRAVLSGIKGGTQVVVKGGFFVWSESAKAGFGDDDH